MNWLNSLSRLDARLSRSILIKQEEEQGLALPGILAHVGAHLGDTVLWVAVGALLWRRAQTEERRHSLLFWAGAMIGALIATLIIKNLFRRERPGTGRFLYGPAADLHSFPSGHGARLGVLWVWAEELFPGSRPLALLAVIWVSLSRVALGIHFVGDILAGLILGWTIGRTALHLSRR